MLRTLGALLVILCCGAAVAADLELQPKSSEHKPSEHKPVERAAPIAPVPPVQLQTTTPPVVPVPVVPVPLAPAPDGREKPAVTDRKPVDTLQPPQAGAPAHGESWWQQVVRDAPNCKVFSDGCRRCDAKFQCSGLPIACQPKEFTCADPQ